MSLITSGAPAAPDLTGIIADPLLEIQGRFMRRATYGGTLQIHTNIQEWRVKAFLLRHVIKRGDEILCEGIETRAFCIRRTAARKRPAST